MYKLKEANLERSTKHYVEEVESLLDLLRKRLCFEVNKKKLKLTIIILYNFGAS
jgi:hypothetical protein